MFVGAGCEGAAGGDFSSPDRKSKGLVVILPGIEGESPLNHDIRDGLSAGGVDCAVTIYNWGRPIPVAGLLLNQMDFLGNRIAGAMIADMIVKYQDAYPDRPVYIVGHSGGGGVAVFAAEAMPNGRRVDGLILLSASISAGYDLTRALDHTRNGIVNFYNRDDVGVLGIGTILAGNVDGMHGPSAGLIGFDVGNSPTRQEAYSRLFQVQLDAFDGGGEDAHFATAERYFVSGQVAPWILSGNWPASSAIARR